MSIRGSYKSVQDHVRVQITKTRIFIPITTRFLAKKIAIKEYYGNECFGLAWDRIKARKTTKTFP